MLPQLVIGTAGHIDHGKSSLVEFLTGISPDRLKEEIKRGITIELGFASLLTPDGKRLAIIDVPGHEKFVRQMVAGASGIDIALLLIAADESIMPQTIEHLEILKLLDIKYGLTILSKIDLCNSEWLNLVEEEAKNFIKNSFLENFPIIKMSAKTGEGKDEFFKALNEVIKQVENKKPGSMFRLPIDRVFTKAGFGTVVTGTAISGQVKQGDELKVYPKEILCKVRGLQVHGTESDSAVAGQRVAINLSNVSKSDISRGHLLAPPDLLKSSNRIDVWLTYLKSNNDELKNRSQARIHIHSAENQAWIILLEQESLKPGESGPAQLVLENPIAALTNDRFVIRSMSPVSTIAGGWVLNPNPARHKRFNQGLVESLNKIHTGSPEDTVMSILDSSSKNSLSMKELTGLLDWSNKKIKSTWDSLTTSARLVIYDKDRSIAMSQVMFQQLKEKILAILKDFHYKYPEKLGFIKEELKGKLPILQENKLLNFILEKMSIENKIIIEREIIRLTSHKVFLNTETTEKTQKIVNALNKSDPPTIKELAGMLKEDVKDCRELLSYLIKQGKIIKLNDEIYYLSTVLEEIWLKAKNIMSSNGEMSISQFKDITLLPRKYSIPLLEYFDQSGRTVRSGDKRILRKKLSSATKTELE